MMPRNANTRTQGWYSERPLLRFLNAQSQSNEKCMNGKRLSSRAGALNVSAEASAQPCCVNRRRIRTKCYEFAAFPSLSLSFSFSLSYIVRFPFIPLFLVRSLFTSSIGSLRFPFFFFFLFYEFIGEEIHRDS